MEDREDRKIRIRKLIIFSILMGGLLATIISLYVTARPLIESHGDLNLVLILAIILLTIAYVMAVKTGIPPTPPKTRELGTRVIPEPHPNPENVQKQGTPVSGPTAGIKSGIPPSPRKTNG
jgi:hypothetical protein